MNDGRLGQRNQQTALRLFYTAAFRVARRFVVDGWAVSCTGLYGTAPQGWEGEADPVQALGEASADCRLRDEEEQYGI
jgi:hypothetical protein